METIAIEFPARRYHATPWDAHVNEGRIEWPPSPWRLLRAFLAVGYNKLGWQDSPDDASKSAIMKLSSVLPVYSVPTGTEAHTRHYMPTRDKTSKVFDAFIRFSQPDSRLMVHFDVNLDGQERAALAKMVEGLSYLGRAESWVDASLLTFEEITNSPQPLETCTPYTSEYGENSTKRNRIRLLTAMPSEKFDLWRSNQIQVTADAMEAEEAAKKAAKGKTLTSAVIKKVRSKAGTQFPVDLLDALQTETATWQNQGWPQPPGSTWVDYHIPTSAIEHQPLTPLAINPPHTAVTAVLLAIDGDGKRGTVRPLMPRALPLMELLHAEAVRKAMSDLGFGNIPVLTGKSDDGEVLRGHTHAHWVPLSLFGQQRIDHVLVHSTVGFSSQAISALAAIRWAYAKGIDRLSINLAGLGTPADIKRQLTRIPSVDNSALRSFQIASLWHSVTPLVLRKFAHKHGKKLPENQIREELMQRGFDEPKKIRFWSPEEMVRQRLKGFVLARKAGKPQPPMERSFAITLEFDRPQQGPIQLGYASHFGLGLLAAEE